MASNIQPEWRVRLLRRLDIVLVIFEFVLSMVFLLTSYVMKSQYLRGCWVDDCLVTGAAAYAIKTRTSSTS